MPTFSVTINETIPVIEVTENQQNVTIQSTSTTVEVYQNGVALVGTPGPTGPQGPAGPPGQAGDGGCFYTSQLYPYPSSQVIIGTLGTADPLGDQKNILFAKYWVHVRQGTSFYLSELLVAYDSNNAYLSESNIIENNGSLGTFTTNFGTFLGGSTGSAASFSVIYLPTNTSGMTIKITKMETTYGGPT